MSNAMEMDIIRASGMYDMLETVALGADWNAARYAHGFAPPNYPMPAIPKIHQWDYVLWCILYVLPALSDEEWEREENEWQDFLDSLD